MNDVLNKLHEQLRVLHDVKETYPTCTIDNAIRQIESRVKHYESKE